MSKANELRSKTEKLLDYSGKTDNWRTSAIVGVGLALLVIADQIEELRKDLNDRGIYR